MAIFHNGVKMNNLYHNGKKIGAIYHNGIKIFQGKYDAGTVLATVGKSIAPAADKPFDADIGDKYTQYFTPNGTFPFDISKVDNGIQINASHSDSIASQIDRSGGLMDCNYYSYSSVWTNPIKISKSDLVAGTKVEISKGASTNDYKPVYAQYKNGALEIAGHSSCYSWSDTGFNGYVIVSCDFMRIDSITTY